MSIISDKNRDITKWALQTAISYGCQEMRTTFVAGTNNSFEYRDNQLDVLESSTENRLYIEVYIDQKYGSFSSNKLDKTELDTFIKGAIESVRFLSEDACRCLPVADRYYKENMDLDLFDAEFYKIPTDRKLTLTKSVIQEITGTHPDIISISSSYSDSISGVYMLASNGFQAESNKTSYSLTANVSLKTATDSRSESYWYDVSTHWQDLQKEGLGKTALQRALDKVGQEKVASGKYELLLDNATSSRLLSPLIAVMYGSAIQQKNSFLIDKLNEKVFSEKLTIIDRPHQKKVLGSRLYDGEGVATKERTIIEKGVLKTYFIDTYYSLKLGVEPTIASPSGLSMQLGDSSHQELIKKIKKGIWVTGFNGGNSNPTTGDFSFGVDGFLIEEGTIIKPISEMNITGNLIQLWSNIEEIGNDPKKNIATQIPSILFRDISFSGLS